MTVEGTDTVSVVIPALNEEESIGFVVGQMPWALIKECIVVDNGSTDATASVAAEAGARVVNSARGYGAACMAGAQAAAPESGVIVFLDGDGSDVVAQLPDLLRPIQEGRADFVIGSRLRGKREPGSMLTTQIVAGRIVGLLLRALYGVAYTDMGPFRAIRRDSLAHLQMKEMTYGWNLEMQMRAAQIGLRILEVPVDYRSRLGGASKVSGSWRGSLKAIVRIVQVLARLAWSGRNLSAVAESTLAANIPVAAEKVASSEEQTGPSVPVQKAGIRLEKKHPLAIRWMHWFNFPVLFTMIWSGLLIYWGDSDNAYQHPHQVYRIGIGTHTLVRFFPTWFWTWYDAPFHITTGLGYHFFFMWLFAINGLFYFAYTVISGEWRFLLPTRQSFGDALQVVLHDLHLRKDPLPHRKFNGAQQIAYTSIIIMGFGSLMTGLAIYKPTQAHWLTSILGGYETARWLHFWLTLGYCGFFLVHIGQVIKAGWNNFRAMVSGYEIVPRDAAPYAVAGRRPSVPELSAATDIEVKHTSRVRTRRSLMVAGTTAAVGFGFYKWLANSPLSGRQQLLLRRTIQANAALSRAVFNERGLAPVYPLERAVPELRFNGNFGIREELKQETWRLQLVGLANPQGFSQYTSDVTQWKYEYRPDPGKMPQSRDDSKGLDAGLARGRRRGAEEAGESATGLHPGTPGLLLTMADIRAFPHVDEITEFKCIEGWSEIVRWGGVRLADLIAAYPPALTSDGRVPRYVYMETPNGDYYCGYDMNTCMHPQSLLVYEMSGRPIDRWHGAPLRLHMPIKYGYKQIKRIGLIAYTDLRPDDYWTKLGYDWYGGL